MKFNLIGCLIAFQLFLELSSKFVMFELEESGLDVMVDWTQVPSLWDKVIVGIKDPYQYKEYTKVYERNNGSWQTFDEVHKGKAINMTIEGVRSNGDKHIFREHTINTLPVHPPTLKFTGQFGKALNISIWRGNALDVVDKYIVTCYTTPNTDVNWRPYYFRYNGMNSVNDYVIFNLLHGANYTFTVQSGQIFTINGKRQGVVSPFSLVTEQFTSLQVPLPLYLVSVREDYANSGVVLTLVKRWDSVQSHFYILCMSPNDTDHECTKGGGMRASDNKKPILELHGERRIEVSGLVPGASYRFAVAAVSGCSVSEYINSSKIVLSEAPDQTSSPINKLDPAFGKYCFETTISTMTTMTISKSAGEAQNDEKESIVSVGDIAAVWAFGGLMAGIIGSLLIIMLRSKYDKVETKKKKRETTSQDPNMLQVPASRQPRRLKPVRQEVDGSQSFHTRSYSSHGTLPPIIVTGPRRTSSTAKSLRF